MSTINMRDNVMQIMNQANTKAKREIYDYLDNVMQFNDKLRTENDQLKSDNHNLKERVRILESREKAMAVEPVTVPLEPKKTLKEAVTDEELFVDGRIDENDQYLYFGETSDKLYEHIGLDRTRGSIHKDKRPVLLVAKDCSGSMGIWEKYMARCITTWTREMLARKYNYLPIVRYVNFHTEAKEVEEDIFFKGGESGGTIASSAGKLLNLIAEEYNYTGDDDIHVLFLSDGDNLTSDNTRLMNQFNKLAVKSEKVWYVEPNQYNRFSTILKAFTELERKGKLTTFCHQFNTRHQVLNVITKMFQQGEEE
ncbi:sporulation protein [Bacillus phage Bcp1]|uniref:Putative sporulation protein YhbH n=1 Tax=Bacillus phage Bcp1 TaxID=584892 RepID=X2JIL8_9CAUD|nr:sporulation protein [Bacillus phage Bcp1]AHN66504.1 putative sporulation protein YhbH [Bacillus phage Bcp1]